MNGTITKYLYDNEDILYELEGSNQIISRFTHGPGIDEPVIMESGSNTYYYHTDGLGSITKLTDPNGAVVQSYTYDSFGNIVAQSGTVTQTYTYTGREYDDESGLYYYRARYYDAKIGRFITADPSHRLELQIPYLLLSVIENPQELNNYVYVINNPVKLIDPEGLEIFVIGRGDFVFRPVFQRFVNPRYTPRLTPKPDPCQIPRPILRPPPTIKPEPSWWGELLGRLADLLGGDGSSIGGGIGPIPRWEDPNVEKQWGHVLKLE